MSFQSLLNSRVNVFRKNPIKDTSGGQLPQFSCVANLVNLPACIQPKTGSAPISLGQRQVFLTHSIYTSSDYGVERGWKLVNPTTGHSYIVHGIVDMGGQTRCFRFDCTLET